MKIGMRMQRLRVQQDLSVKEVALKAGVPLSTYRDWENGREIKGEPYVKIAEALNVSLYTLMTGESANPSTIYGELDKIEQACRALRKHAGSLS